MVETTNHPTESHELTNTIQCWECGTIGMSFKSDELADPDRHGNRRYGFECPECGTEGTCIHIPHGGEEVTEGFDIRSHPYGTAVVEALDRFDGGITIAVDDQKEALRVHRELVEYIPTDTHNITIVPFTGDNEPEVPHYELHIERVHYDRDMGMWFTSDNDSRIDVDARGDTIVPRDASE